MASTCVTGFLVVLLVLQPWITLSYLLPPVFSPVYDDVCKEVVCGKGTCKPSNQSAFLLFECECYPGWKQANFGLADNKFLPCVVPDCTINYSCMNAFSPVQDKGSRANESIFDPCHWTNCGGGFCNKTSNLTYSCECEKDYYNILNDTFLPCFQDCAIGMDCSTLGISSSNKPTSVTQVLYDDGMNHATSILQGHSLWLITLMTFMAMVQWK
nr:slit homolog 2 protein-like isoform X1 [Quercus suber]